MRWHAVLSRSRWAAVLASLAVLAGGCAGRPAAAQGPLPERLAERAQAWAARADVPETGVVVRRGGAQVWASGGRQFRIASITKLFMATLIMGLVEDGVLTLDARVGGWVPQLPAARDVTLRQLLNHTSGLPDYGAEDFTQALVAHRDRRWTEAQVLQTVAGIRPPFAPGQAHEYSNTNYVALAQIVTAVTGESWVTLLRRRILDPLGLQSTYVAGTEVARGPGLVTEAYFDLDNDGAYEDIEEGAWPALETSESAAGAIVSTAGDVAVFTEALFTGRVLDPGTVELMVAPGPHGRRYDDYGLGVELRHPDLQTLVWGHGGFLPGHRAVTWYVPSQDTTITVLANHSLANPPDLADLLLQELTVD